MTTFTKDMQDKADYMMRPRSMGKWGHEGPNEPDKGMRLGSCNVTACQRSGAFWYNRVTCAWYCTSCAHKINYQPLPDGEFLCVLDKDALSEFDEIVANYA